MLKKVFVGLFIAIMVGAVIAGIVELVVPSAHASAQQGRGQGGSRQETAARSTPNQGTGQGQQSGQGQGQGRGTVDVRGDPVQNAAGGRGYGGGQGQQSGQGQGQSQQGQGSRAQSQSETVDWLTIEGTVLETTELLIDTVDQGQVQVGLGQSHYREEQGFVLEVGHQVLVTGYWEEGEFKAGQVENLSTGQSIVLRDESGRPMWSGQGRRSG